MQKFVAWVIRWKGISFTVRDYENSRFRAGNMEEEYQF